MFKNNCIMFSYAFFVLQKLYWEWRTPEYLVRQYCGNWRGATRESRDGQGKTGWTSSDKIWKTWIDTTWEEAKELATDRAEWRQRVAQCIHRDARWTKTKTKTKKLLLFFIAWLHMSVSRWELVIMLNVVGRIMWSRQLFRRIEQPMMEFKRHSQLLQSNDARQIIRNYNKLSRTLLEYELMYYRCWVSQVRFDWFVYRIYFKFWTIT